MESGESLIRRTVALARRFYAAAVIDRKLRLFAEEFSHRAGNRFRCTETKGLSGPQLAAAALQASSNAILAWEAFGPPFMLYVMRQQEAVLNDIFGPLKPWLTEAT